MYLNEQYLININNILKIIIIIIQYNIKDQNFEIYEHKSRVLILYKIICIMYKRSVRWQTGKRKYL